MKKCLFFLMIFTFLPLVAFAEEKGGNEVHLYALNIGKADCMILSYQDQHYLIDTGYEHTYPALETALKALEINSLHVEYDFGPIQKKDFVDISTENDSFYCTIDQTGMITKLAFATEELYLRSQKKPGLKV